MTMPADQALLRQHLSAAAGHLQHAIACVERLSADPHSDVDQAYAQRAELKSLAATLADMTARFGVSP